MASRGQFIDWWRIFHLGAPYGWKMLLQRYQDWKIRRTFKRYEVQGRRALTLVGSNGITIDWWCHHTEVIKLLYTLAWISSYGADFCESYSAIGPVLILFYCILCIKQRFMFWAKRCCVSLILRQIIRKTHWIRKSQFPPENVGVFCNVFSKLEAGRWESQKAYTCVGR